jgi:6-phosphogluconolactonase (cycloisomerase 2 family)
MKLYKILIMLVFIPQSMHADGFTQVPGSPFATAVGPDAIAFSPVASGNIFAAAVNSTSNNVFMYQVNPTTGVFTVINGYPVATQTFPNSVAYSPLVSGNTFVAVGNSSSNNISVYSANQTTGILTEVAGSPFATGLQPQGVVFSPVVSGNLFAAVGNRNDNTISVYTVNQSTGAFTTVSGSPFVAGAGPYQLGFALATTGTLFLAAGDADGSTVSMYGVNKSTGALTQVPGSPFTASNPFGLAFSPIVSGNLFLAAPSITGNSIIVYSVNQVTGALTQVPGSPFAANIEPQGMAFSPVVSGNLFAAVANSADHSVSVYSVNQSTGVFSQVSGSPFAAGNNPTNVSFLSVAGNLFAAASNFNDNTVSMYLVNQTTGAFTPVSGSPFSSLGLETQAVAFSPLTSANQVFAAVINASSATVASFIVNQTTGAFTSANNLPQPTGTTPTGVAFSPIISGNLFAAICNVGSNNVLAYKVNQTTGALTAVPGSPFAAGSHPEGVAFSPIASNNLFAAVTNFEDNTVSVYQVDPTSGSLAQVTGSPFATALQPQGIAFAPVVSNNLFAAVTNFNSNNVSVYNVNQSTGLFTQVSGSPFVTGNSPAAVSFSPIVSGNLYAAVANYIDSNVSIYNVNQTTGAFTQVSGSPFSVVLRPLAVSFSPLVSNNLFLAVPNSEDDSISVFTASLTTGTLTQIAGSPFGAQAFPSGVAFSPQLSVGLTGQSNVSFAAITNQDSNNISVYQMSFAAGSQDLGLLFPPATISGCKTKNVFLTQTDYVNILTWTAPQSGPPVNYYIYRDAALTDVAGIVPGNQLTFIDHNRKPNVTYTYYVVSADANNNFSTAMSITVTQSC